MTTEFDYLKSWILGFLSTPQELLNNFPTCPYAKKALTENKIKFFKSINYVDDIAALFNNWNDQYQVAICVVPADVEPKKFSDDVKKINNVFLKRGFACLEDHKDILENFHSLQFNNGKYNIILCQPIKEINESSKILLAKGYYKNWSKEMYDDVVSWRLSAD